jgi:hypothetical protein
MMIVRMYHIVGMLAVVASLVVGPPLLRADIIAQGNDEARALAEPILDNILRGFASDEYAVYARDFDATLIEAVSEDKFAQTKQWYDQTLGDCVEKEYLGFLNKGRMTAVLWKGKFAKSSEDILIKLVLSKRGESCYVTGLWFLP